MSVCLANKQNIHKYFLKAEEAHISDSLLFFVIFERKDLRDLRKFNFGNVFFPIVIRKQNFEKLGCKRQIFMWNIVPKSI